MVKFSELIFIIGGGELVVSSFFLNQAHDLLHGQRLNEGLHLNVRVLKTSINQFWHKRCRHRLDMEWTNVQPADK